jgi:ABC-type multidrug transport system ATPase subunit
MQRPSLWDPVANPVTVRFDNLCWTTPEPDAREVLHNVTGSVGPGMLLAIMGPSGAGKTTLIQILCGREKPSQGSVTLNGHPMSKAGRRAIGYVTQEDVLFSNLTVRETLQYAALLRLPASYARSMKLKRVEHVIDELKLRKVADTIIGDNLKRGIRFHCDVLLLPLLRATVCVLRGGV